MYGKEGALIKPAVAIQKCGDGVWLSDPMCDSGVGETSPFR